MDDFLKSNDSEKYLLTLLEELIEILSNFSLSLTKWLSNSNIIMSSLAQSELSSKFKVFILDFRSIGFFEFLLLIQDFWRKKLNWDDLLISDLQVK